MRFNEWVVWLVWDDTHAHRYVYWLSRDFHCYVLLQTYSRTMISFLLMLSPHLLKCIFFLMQNWSLLCIATDNSSLIFRLQSFVVRFIQMHLFVIESY